MPFEAKVALVTGGASGIGGATVRQLAEAGATVYALDRDGARLATEFADRPGVIPLAVDISDSAAVNAAFARVGEERGRLDILVNGAGINAPTAESNAALVAANVRMLEALHAGERPRITFIEETSDEDFLQVMRVNLFSQFYCLRAGVPLMKRAGGGAIVNISSVAALVGVTMPLYYPASKAGVLGLTRAAAAELAPFNIRVNAVCPGAVDTPLMHQQPREVVDFLVSMQPIRRMADPEELARTILFLADETRSGYYTGQTISPNGGMHM